MSTVIDALRQEHVEVLAQIARVEHRLENADVCAGFLDYLEHEVATHFATEEETLFPELARIPPIAGGPLRVMNAEHDTFRDLLQSARRARHDGNDHKLSKIAADLATLLQGHIAKEDGVLFPLALDLLTAEQLARVDSRVSQRTPAAESKVE